MEIKEINTIISNLKAVRDEAAAHKIIQKEIDAKEFQLEQQLIQILVENELQNFRGTDGLVSLAAKTSVKTPKTPADREAFFNYLKSEGIYDALVSVNSSSLNALYKEKFAAAVESGDIDFKIPGLNEVTITQSLSFRKS